MEINGAQLRQARITAGIGLRELARQAGVSFGHLSQIERDLRTITPSDVLRYERALNAKIEDAVERADATASVDTMNLSRRDVIRGLGGASLAHSIPAFPDPEMRERVAADRPHGKVDPTVVGSLRETLGTYRRLEDSLGGVGVWSVVHSQLDTVTRLIPKSSGKVTDELLCLSAEHAHWLSWVSAGEGKAGAALSWLDMAHGWASDAGSVDLMSWVARVRSSYALRRDDTARALRLAEQARQLAHAASPATGAIAAHAEAMAAAAAGQADRARRLGDESYALGQRSPDAADRPSWLYWLDPVRVELLRADIAFAVGDWSVAAAIYSASLDMLRDYPRDHGYYESRFRQAQALC